MSSAVIGDPTDPDSLYHFMGRYLQHKQTRHYSPHTLKRHQGCLSLFIQWCDERGLSHPQDITQAILERYRRVLFLHRKKNGEPLAIGSQCTHLVTLRSYFKWLARQHHILYNPASELELPSMPQQLPKHILNAHEVEQILQQPDIQTPIGLRDRAVLETLYSTGIRRSELVQLTLFDIDQERGTLMIRQGKGKKDRFVPIGERALAWLDKYNTDVRPELLLTLTDPTLFLSRQGAPLKLATASSIARRYVKEAQINKTGACHLFRHTMATLMLENGADIRFIQAILGHSNLNTTQVYTQVSIHKLKEIHTATHPAKLSRTPE